MSELLRRLHIVHVITGLHLGGAEMMLYKILARMDHAAFSAEVVALTAAGELRPRVEALGIPVSDLGMRASLGDVPRTFLALRRLLATRVGAVVQTWMYHADLIGGCAARSAGRRPVLWDIQGSHLDPATTNWTTKLAIKAGARLSHLVPDRIISCGHATKQVHVALGYDAARMLVIPNAVDLDAFKPDPDARAGVRRELGLPDGAFVVGLGARFDPQKDHRTVLEAFGRLQARGAHEAHLLLFGKDVTGANPVLAQWLKDSGAVNVHLLGPRPDVARLFAACDAGCLSSAYGEGLPNIVVEAMAAGLPCVVTDVGDSAWVVGETGHVAPPRDPERLSDGLFCLASMTPEALGDLGMRARRRVESHFDLDAVAARYYSLYEELVRDR